MIVQKWRPSKSHSPILFPLLHNVLDIVQSLVIKEFEQYFGKIVRTYLPLHCLVYVDDGLSIFCCSLFCFNRFAVFTCISDWHVCHYIVSSELYSCTEMMCNYFYFPNNLDIYRLYRTIDLLIDNILLTNTFI